MFQTKTGHSTSPKVIAKKGKRSILKMANNLVGQLKETDLSRNHTKAALRKVNGKSMTASNWG